MIQLFILPSTYPSLSPSIHSVFHLCVCFYSFLHSFIHLLLCSIIYSFIYSCIYLTHSFICNLINVLILTSFFPIFKVRNISSFVELVQKGYHLASLLQLNMSFAEGLQNKSAYEQRTAYIRGMWGNLGPILCGPSPKKQQERVIRHMFDFRCVTRSCQTRALRLMFYLLTHNPKILYTPNNTAADDVIKEVFG